MKVSKSKIVKYLYALLVVGTALAIRFLLLPATGPGGPFILFSAAVLITSFFWGVGAGIFAAAVSTPIAAYLFVYQAHYTSLQAFAQILVFIIEISVICYLADRFAQAKKRAESSERTARLALEERQIFFALIENASDFIAISDEKMRVHYINPAGRRMVGLPGEKSLKSIQLLDLSPAGQREMVSKVIIPAVLKNDCWHGNTYLLEQNKKSEIAVSSSCCTIRNSGSNEIVGIGIVARDVSEIMRAEEALNRSVAELNEAQRVARVGNWNWDIKTDQNIWSDELHRIFGREGSKSVPGYNDLLKFFTQDSAKKLDQAVTRTLKDGSRYELELQLARPSGERRWIVTRGEAIRSGSGEIVGIRGTAQDITDLKELQQMREEWNSVIAHDLRQPISLISMSAELLPSLHAGEMSDSERVLDERIRSAAMSLSRMVDDLLDISRMEASRLVLERKWLDPKILVHESLDRMSQVLSGVGVSLVDDEELLPVFVDQMRIEQVISNLVSNAVKYGEKGSKIMLRINQLSDELKVSVTNEGRGISEEEIPTLFDRFWRSKSTRTAGVPGLGLGLYIAKGLIEAHGGRIWVESTPGKTTTFSFTLPTRVVSDQEAA